MNWQDPALVSTIINAVTSIITTIIGTVGAAVIGKRFLNTEKLKRNLKVATDDIAFLLAVETAHLKRNTDSQGSRLKVKVREEVRASGLVWSGKFTPGRVAALEQLGDDSSKLIKLYRKYREMTEPSRAKEERKPDVAN